MLPSLVGNLPQKAGLRGQSEGMATGVKATVTSIHILSFFTDHWLRTKHCVSTDDKMVTKS